MPTLFQSPARLIDAEEKRTTSKKPMKHTTASPANHGKGTIGPLTCFAVSPDGVRFETQEETEDVILFLRQHPIVLLPAVLILTGLLLAPPFLFPLLADAVGSLPVALPSGYALVGSLLWYTVTFGFALVSFLRWFFNIYIVTNQRVVDIDFKYLLYKEFSEAKLTKIQDLTYTSGGIIAALFNYGDILVETAGEVPNIEFEKVPHPDRIVQTLSELTGKTKGTL